MAAFRLTPAARNSLSAIGRYTEREWGRAKRDEYLRGMDACFHSLAKHPCRGHIRDDVLPGLRSIPFESHVVYYLYREKTVIVVDVLHSRMDTFRHLAPKTP